MQLSMSISDSMLPLASAKIEIDPSCMHANTCICARARSTENACVAYTYARGQATTLNQKECAFAERMGMPSCDRILH